MVAPTSRSARAAADDKPAKKHQELSISTRRINAGRDMIADLPLGDKRYDKWRSHLISLIQERKRLQSL